VRAIRRAQRQNEDTIVVLGAGVIGLCTIQILKAMGVSKVIVSGRRVKRLEAAKESGADQVIDAAKEDPIAMVKEATSEMLANMVFECAGSPATFQQSIEMVQNGGKVILVGEYEQPVNWNPTIAVSKSLSLIGSWAGHFPGAIEFLQSGQVNAKFLITHELPLDKAKEAFETQLGAQDAIKVMVKA
jgi:2-desacetyl-2-hydroxyethyl bacteriochlorophyllide A dehydrogenase